MNANDKNTFATGYSLRTGCLLFKQNSQIEPNK